MKSSLRQLAYLLNLLLLLVTIAELVLWVRSSMPDDMNLSWCSPPVRFKYFNVLMLYSTHGHLIAAGRKCSIRQNGVIVESAIGNGGLDLCIDHEDPVNCVDPSFTHRMFQASRKTLEQRRGDGNIGVTLLTVVEMPHWAVAGVLLMLLVGMTLRLSNLRGCTNGSMVLSALWRLTLQTVGVAFWSVVLLLFSFICVAWLRSYWATPSIARQDCWVEVGESWCLNSCIGLQARRGRIEFIFDRETTAPPGTPIHYRAPHAVIYCLSEQPLIARNSPRVSGGILGFLYFWKRLIDPPPDLPGECHAQEYIVTGHILIPCWLPLGLLAATIAFGIRRWILHNRQRSRVIRGLCLQCGYDIRANSGRCPECGAACKTVNPSDEISATCK